MVDTGFKPYENIEGMASLELRDMGCDSIRGLDSHVEGTI